KRSNKEGRTMHFVTGGAYNGKTAWVEKHYASNDANDMCWIDASDKTTKWPNMKEITSSVFILKNLEQWIWIWLSELPDIESVRSYGYEKILELIAWEKHLQTRQVIIIGTDMSKGIVPMNAVLRDWRDITGGSIKMSYNLQLKLI